jgi:preprotein translocase subunit SecY
VILLRNFWNMLFIPELRSKLVFTLGVLIVERLGTFIPVIGVNVQALGDYMAQATSQGGLLGYLDIFSGGALSRATVFALGIGPYITASIMMQMLSMTIPSLELMMKEGEYGRQQINQYTRYLTIGLSIMYSSGYAAMLEYHGLVLVPGWAFRLFFILSLTTGSVIVMWLGEQISLHGLGNGSSVIIFSNIISQFPAHFIKTIEYVRAGEWTVWHALIVLAFYLIVAACIVFLERGERKVPVQYARRVIGQRVYGGQSSYIPFKINTASVMPIIFASAFLQMPYFVIRFLSTRYESMTFLNEWFMPNGALHNTMEFLLIIFFSFFYTALMYNPDELAENLKKSGGFIPGIRPGKKTAEFFNYLLTRIGLIGALYIAILAIIPNIMYEIMKMPFMLRGTSILIAVGVAMELSAIIESYLIEHKYEGFLMSGRLKGRTIR